jgi:hypothetical protein
MLELRVLHLEDEDEIVDSVFYESKRKIPRVGAFGITW